MKRARTLRCHRHLLSLLAALAACTASQAGAWEIRTLVSDPCHEQLTLGAVGAATGHWAQIPQEPGRRLLEILEARVDLHGVPSDRSTWRWVEHELRREGLGESLSESRRYVLASFIAGSRAPDLEGNHPSSILDLRDKSLRDDKQHEHTIRRGFDAPGEEGDLALLGDTRSFLEATVEAVERAWAREGLPMASTLWRVQGYQDQRVNAFAPAYLLGRAAHALQDSYTHVLRDDDGAIVAVLNFVDAVQQDYDPERDGLPHSFRLDTCDVVNDPFDRQRFTDAQRATHEFIAAAVARLAPGATGAETLDEVLDRVLEYRPGCHGGDFCGSPWLEHAREGAVGPYFWMGCYRADFGTRGAGLPLLGILAAWLWAARRPPQRKVRGLESRTCLSAGPPTEVPVHIDDAGETRVRRVEEKEERHG